MSSFKMNSILGALALATTAYAHGHVKSYTLNGQTIVGGVNGGLGRNPRPNTAAWLANNIDNGFVIDPTNVDMVCHRGGVPGSSSLTVAAGETITMTWDQWPESHAGPIIDYLAPVAGDFASISKSSLQFVKIAEAGLSGGSWAALDLIKNGLTWPVTIPADVAPGNYVLRHEILALHEGNRQGGTQFYPLCTNIVVTGSGTNALANGTPATELYKASDPGVLFNMYNNPTSYPIPGPKLLAGGGGGGGGNNPAPSPAPAPTTTSQANAPTTTLQTSTRAPAVTNAPVPACPGTGNGGAGKGKGNGQGNGQVGATAAKYQQCGGQNFNGPTACASGSTCTVQNPYYSQCL